MAENNRKPKICIVVAADVSLDTLFPDFYPLLLAKGYEVVGICADGPYVENVRRQGVRVIMVPMARAITPLHDLKCIWKLYRIFKKEKFDIIHYSTLKASFLTAIAVRLAGGAVLIYTIRGFHIFTGLKQFVIKCGDRVASRSADYVIAISKSLKDKVVNEGILPADRINVLGAGSSRGVNVEKFKLNEKTKSAAENIRKDLEIKEDDIVIGYAGRLTIEKGIVELLTAFDNIRWEYNNVHLFIIGDQDKRKPMSDDVFEWMDTDPHIHPIPWTDDIVSYMAATDIFVLPTYHDGFGNVLIEAAALEKPVIGTDVPGARDALQDGVNGIMVKARDVASLERALRELIESPDKRIRMGKEGRKWVVDNFDRKMVWSRLLEVYEKLLSAKRGSK
jgi:glycosyltransferase involved in cell wall biosynthesis